MKLRDRITDFRRVRAGDLVPHPENWRTHPDGQRTALQGVLAEIGIADALIVRELPDGQLQVLDGHLRRDVAPDTEWPCLVVDLDDDEARKFLVTFDPLAAMAEANQQALGELMAGLETESKALREMLDGLAEREGIDLTEDGVPPEGDDKTYTNKIVAPVYEPKGEKPPLSALIDRTKTEELIKGISEADLPNGVKEFLRLAAERHTVFNFRQIAEFYCHADATLQDLMERSGLVIIDFNKAIEYGFVHLTEKLGALADQEEFREG